MTSAIKRARGPRSSESPDPADLLRQAGLVFTLQRRAIWSAFADRCDHPTADEVFDTLGESVAGISRTTVYRTLEAFVRVGLARRVGHLGTSVRYDPRTGRHHHLVCESCGTVRDVEDDALEPVGLTLAEDAFPGFKVRDLSVLVRGRCADCT